MRKRMIAAAFACIVLFSLAGCGKTADGFVPSENKNASHHMVLALREGTYADVIEGCLADFEKKHDVAIDVYELSEDGLHSAVADDAANDEGAYDLCMVDGSWMQEYTAENVLTKLNDYGYTLDDDIIPATTEICYRDGDTYLAPYYGNVTVLLYNKSILERAGYAAEGVLSVGDMQRICNFAKKTHNLGFMYRGDSENNIVVDFLPVLLACGGWVVDEDNHPTVDTPEFHRAMESYMALIDTGKPASRDELVIAVANNAAAMAIGWPGWYTPERNSTADYIAIPVKGTADGKTYNTSVYGVWTIGVPANSMNKGLAVELLSYLMDPKVQLATVEKGGVPCRYSCLRDPEVLEKFPQYEAVRQALENGVYRPIMEEWTDFYTILGAHMREIINGEKNVDKGLKEAQEELEALCGSKQNLADEQ
ncbi:MAG: extracellular solute-binding protein [Lachnospiraceae bacterium]|nr:extracellular solute-binding protein [Lachnospiraceae bacterium]